MTGIKTLSDLFYNIKKSHDRPDLLNYRADNIWKSISTEEFSRTVICLSKGLSSLGVKKGEKIGIISNPSPFWVIADLAIVLAGCITVPIFRRISPENMEFEINDSELNFIFIGDMNEYEPVKFFGKRIKKIITIGFKKEDSLAISFGEVIKLGSENQNSFDANMLLSENDLFTIIYTSGSTGVPKGVMLSHQNIISQIEGAQKCFRLDKGDKAMSSLPLSHIFERMVLYFYLSVGIPVYFVDDLNNIGNLIREVNPSIMTVVPRLLEKIHDKILDTASGYKGLSKSLALAAFNRAEKKENTKAKNPADFFYDILVYSKIRKSLGGKLGYVISGAAPLPVHIGNFFLNIGIPLYEGYGLTEASPVIACNKPDFSRMGTVGMPFPGVCVKIGDDGEILAKGHGVMKGYHNNTGENTKALDCEGFLHTGDLGSFDADGYLKITGRKKELFKKSTGEYVSPVPIEQQLSKLDIVDIAVVIAESRKYVSCLLFPDFEKVKRLKIEEGYENLSDGQYLESDHVQKKIREFIDEMNKHLHHTEEVQKFRIIMTPISIETGELTPTMKIRRGIIEEKFKKEIDSMYV